MSKPAVISLSPAEIQSGLDRVAWAEGLILQLPKDHDGRNSWLLNYGTRNEAKLLRAARGVKWDARLDAAEPSSARWTV